MSSLARGMNESERTLLAGIAAPEPRCFTCGDEPGDCPDCRPFIPPAPFELETATGPDPIAAAWEAGYDAGQDAAEQRVRDLEYTVGRLEGMLADARADLIGRGR